MNQTIKKIEAFTGSKLFLNMATAFCVLAVVAEEELQEGSTPHSVARIAVKGCIALGIYSSRRTENK